MSKAGANYLRGAGWGETLLQMLPHGAVDLTAWMDEKTRVLKRDRHSQVGLLEVAGRYCYLKFYKHKSLLQRQLFKRGVCRGARSFDNALRLADAGIAVPQPLCCLLVPEGLLLLTEGFTDSVDLKTLWLQPPEPETLEQLLPRVGVALGGLHSAGFSHGDCKWSNFLLVRRQEGGKQEYSGSEVNAGTGELILLIDLEDVKPRGAGFLRDFARFTVNAEDMGLSPEHYRAFLESYCDQRGLNCDALISASLRQVVKLRRQHQKKYGSRGHQLV